MRFLTRDHYPGRFLLAACALALISTSVAAGQGEELPKGQVIQRVACKRKPEQTYALYLPSTYSPNRTWSLLAAFDPAARGRVPVERFKDAAERYGYIVCGSNNSRNGPWAPTLTAADAMLNDITSRFAIEENRVYLTGFSGGARVATRVATLLAGRIAGVIGCGAGFTPGFQPSKSLPFVYFGIVGTEDFNYPEMMQLDRSLEEVGLNHRIARFEGGHGWAPTELCSAAIEWMEMQAMKAGTRPRDETMLDGWFRKAIDKAGADAAAGRTYEAYIEWAAAADDFKGLRDVSEPTKRAATLKESKEVKQAIKQERDLENEQLRRVAELLGLRARLRDRAITSALDIDYTASPTANPPDGLSQRAATANAPEDDSSSRQIVFSDLRAKLSDLRKRSNAKERTPDRLLARRILNNFAVVGFEPAMLLIASKKYQLAIQNLSVDSELMPDNSGLLYYLARAYSLKGDKKRAIDTLSRAIHKGFDNASELEQNHDLDSLRDDPAFRKLVEGLKQKD